MGFIFMKLRWITLVIISGLLLACDRNEDTPSFSYLALGDSYTIGQSVAESERWPVQLATNLSEQGTSVRPPVIIARTGWRADQLIEAVEGAGNLGAQYDMVSLLIGVNNQFQGQPVTSFTPDFEKLLQMAIGLTGGNPDRVFVLSIPDYGVTPFGIGWGGDIGAEIDEYNAASKTICDQYGITWFDITPISREAATNMDLIATDRLHPSGKMYERWVDLISQDINRLLSR